MRTRDYDKMDAVELAGSLEKVIQDACDAFNYTMVVVFAFMGPTFALVDFAEKELGADGPQLLATLLQRYDNGTAAAGEGLAELAEFAAGEPKLAEAIVAGRYDGLDDVEGGQEFMDRLRQYLDEYGWRAESWGLSHVSTWAEEPRVALELIGRYLSDASQSPADALKRALEQRDEAWREVESRLGDAKLAEFKEKLEACLGHVPISEDRARWQLTIVGSVRVPFLALGRKLVEAGVIGEPNDVFYFSVEELKDLARTAQSQIALVAERKAQLERWESLTPPEFVGVPPAVEPPPEMQTLLTRFFGLGVTPSTEKNVINGNAASRGTARGRARVIRDLSEAGRLQKGEILVCRATAPPWTPLFAIAAAIVTDTGGVLSHSAICAREYGIPCVVGTQNGTREIPDGAMITVDGAQGIVRIEA
jgi:pyruvate,water dikinase